jgi:type I restriction enzyme M protein
VPKEARWSHLHANAKQPSIGKLIDEAMPAIEANPGLKASCPRIIIARRATRVMLGEVIDLVSGSAMGAQGDKAKGILGRVYEYFLSHYVRNGTVE